MPFEETLQRIKDRLPVDVEISPGNLVNSFDDLEAIKPSQDMVLGQLETMSMQQLVNYLYMTRWTLEGVPDEEIAPQLGVTPDSVKVWRRRVKRYWQQQILETYDEKKAQEIARLNMVEWRAWRTIENLDDAYAPGAERTQADLRREKYAWDRIQWAMERRAKMMGLDAPRETVSWQAELREMGMQPDQMYDVMVNRMAKVIEGDVIDGGDGNDT